MVSSHNDLFKPDNFLFEAVGYLSMGSSGKPLDEH